MAINVYPAVFEFFINAKNNYDIIFFAQRCNAILVYYNDKWQYNDLTLCPSSTQHFSFVRKCHAVITCLTTAFLANSLWKNVRSNICSRPSEQANTCTCRQRSNSKQASHGTISMLSSSSSINRVVTELDTCGLSFHENLR
jgi:hypothetical protein